jgi:hypothetical protein
MFCELLRAMDTMARIILGILCCLLCGGPILIIVGIVLLTSDNARQGDIADYTTAVDKYQSNDFKTLSTASMSINYLSMARRLMDVEVQGNLEGVPNATHYVFVRPNVQEVSNQTYQLQYAAATGSTSELNFVIPWFKKTNRQLRCARDQCTDDCSSSNYKCDSSEMNDYCSGEFMGTYVDDDGTCYAGDICGTCTFNGLLSSACLVIKLDGTAATPSNLVSCYYPFQDHEYSSTSTSATFEVMSEDDPFIALQRITDGKNDFGITEAQQKNAGLVCLIVGIILTVCVGVGLFFFMRHHNNNQQEQGGYGQNQQQGPHGPHGFNQGQQMQPVTGQPVGQQQGPGGYGNQQGYPPQQGGYNQGPPVSYPPQQQQGGYSPANQQYPPPQGGGYPPMQQQPPQGYNSQYNQPPPSQGGYGQQPQYQGKQYNV